MPVGQVIRSHSNNYYVLIDGREVLCRPRGRFRQDQQWVLVGDRVEVYLEGQEGRIDRVMPRKSELRRPPVANVDQMLLVFTLKEPEADYLFLDRLLVHGEQAGVEPVIILNKVDLLDRDMVAAFCRVYQEQVGYRVVPVSALRDQGMEELRPLLKDRVSVLAGHSGVGKSQLIRTLQPSRQDLRVGQLSKVQRGRHTTRHVELIAIDSGGLIMDTPGFTHVEFVDMEKHELREYFREFGAYQDQCRFDDCVHRKEPNCAVRSAADSGRIAASRYEHYLLFLEEVESLKRW